MRSHPHRRIALTALLTVCLSGPGCGKTPDSGADTAQSGDVGGAADAAADVATDVAPDVGQRACPAPPAAAGEARARALACAADLPLGHHAAARVGDLVLENALARFVVRVGSAGESVVGLVGGNVVDAVRLDAQGKQLGVDMLREWVPIVAMHLVSPKTVAVVDPGGPGRVAVVRVTGKLVPFPTVHAFLPLDLPPVTVTNEYRLAPGSAALELRTVVKPTNGKKDDSLVGDATFWGGDVGLYRPGSGAPGSDLEAPSKPSMLGIVSTRSGTGATEAAIGFAEPISTIDAGGILAFIQPTGGIPPAGRTFVRHLAVGDGDGPGLAQSMAQAAALAGGSYGTLEGTVSGHWSGVEVELLDDKDLPLTRCRPDDAGAFSCPAPATTRGVRALWVGNGAGQAGGLGQADKPVPVAVKAGETATVTLAAPKPSKLTVAVRDAAGDGVAFQARLIPQTSPVKVSERVFVDGDGDATFLLPPGTWQVWIHHGPEWTAHNETLKLTVGGTAKVQATLKHVVDTKGWVACDTHIHAEHSSDSDVPNRERILDAIAAGLDYAVATDHDYVTDYTPWLKAAGLSDRITVASGVEVSTSKLGHHNVWPLKPDTNQSGAGGPMWHNLSAAVLMTTLRGKDPARMHQVNHPRGSQSYFQGIKFDPKTTDKKLLTFDAMELLNSKRIDDTNEVLTDWFGLLDRGLKRTAVGTSDTHSLSSGAGGARTFAWVGLAKDGTGRDRQGVFTAGEADAAIRAGKAVATTGPLMTVALLSGGVTVTMGDTLTGAKGTVRAEVRVLAPEWMPLGTVSVFHNGSEVKVVDLSSHKAANGVKDVTVAVEAPAAQKAGWWSAVLRANKDQPRPPIQGREVWAITNPVYETP